VNKTMKREICKTCQWVEDYTCHQYRWSEVSGENDGLGNPKSIYIIEGCEYTPYEEFLEENESEVKRLAKKYRVNIYDGFYPHNPIFKYSEL